MSILELIKLMKMHRVVRETIQQRQSFWLLDISRQNLTIRFFGVLLNDIGSILLHTSKSPFLSFVLSKSCVYKLRNSILTVFNPNLSLHLEIRIPSGCSEYTLKTWGIV